MALCIWLGAALAAALPIAEFTLAWTHSIERTRWEEDWRVTAGGLELVEARIRSSGAGMEPPDGALLRDGVWHYRPRLAPLPALELAGSRFAGDYEICFDGGCRVLSDIAAAAVDAQNVKFAACTPYRADRSIGK